jgi:hypothetical protein
MKSRYNIASANAMLNNRSTRLASKTTTHILRSIGERFVHQHDSIAGVSVP